MTASTSPSRRKAWVMPMVRWYAERRLTKAFENVFVAGLEATRAIAEAGPILIAANHVAWWDPFVAVTLDALLGTEGYALMDADNLARLPFFASIGAVRLRRDHPRHAHADMTASLELLRGPRTALWIFPQGKQRPSHLRPLGLAPGVHHLASRSAATVIALSISYLYREAAKPAVFASFSAPLALGARRAWLGELEAALVAGLDDNDTYATGGKGPHVALWREHTASSVPLAGRLLARASGGDTRA